MPIPILLESCLFKISPPSRLTDNDYHYRLLLYCKTYIVEKQQQFYGGVFMIDNMAQFLYQFLDIEVLTNVPKRHYQKSIIVIVSSS